MRFNVGANAAVGLGVGAGMGIGVGPNVRFDAVGESGVGSNVGLRKGVEFTGEGAAFTGEGVGFTGEGVGFTGDGVRFTTEGVTSSEGSNVGLVEERKYVDSEGELVKSDKGPFEA